MSRKIDDRRYMENFDVQMVQKYLHQCPLHDKMNV